MLIILREHLSILKVTLDIIEIVFVSSTTFIPKLHVILFLLFLFFQDTIFHTFSKQISHCLVEISIKKCHRNFT